MSEGLNRVMLIGNLGSDPELRMTATGQAILKMRLATSENYLDRNQVRQERTEWHNIVVWGKRGEGLGKILHKGDRIGVEGSLRTSEYDDRDGNKRYRTEIISREVILCGGKREGGGSGGGGGYSGGQQSGSSSGNRGGGKRGGGYGSGGGGGGYSEEDYGDQGGESGGKDLPF